MRMAKIKLKDWNPRSSTKEIIEIIVKLVEQYDIPLTVRQVHYKLVEIPEAHHPNTQSAYSKCSRILTKMRQAGLLDWDKIIDETRTIYKTESYEDIDDAEERLLQEYRRDRWKDNDYYIEVWTEKRTLVRQFYQITNEYDVFLASGGGFSSSSYIYDAIRRLHSKIEDGKEIIILYFGDLDPSGDFMDVDIQKRFEEWGVDVKMKRICLNYSHLKEFNLPKKFDVRVKKGNKIYNKIQADPRAKRMYEKFGEVFQVELEALDPNILKAMLEESILEYVDTKQQEEVKLVEQEEVKDTKKKLGYKDEKKEK